MDQGPPQLGTESSWKNDPTPRTTQELDENFCDQLVVTQSGEVTPDSLRVPSSNTTYSPNRREGEWWHESPGEGLI